MFDYVRHMRKHHLPVDGIRVAFTEADSIDQLSRLLKTLAREPTRCDWFEAADMAEKYLLSINLVRRHLQRPVFNGQGRPASSDDPDPYTRF